MNPEDIQIIDDAHGFIIGIAENEDGYEEKANALADKLSNLLIKLKHELASQVPYKMRGLPCRDARGKEMEWSVCGSIKYGLPAGSEGSARGVLEWCWNEKDAQQVMEQMKKDPRFSDLFIRQEN